MPIVREVAINNNGAFSQDFDCELMGARGLIYQAFRDEGTLCQMTATGFTGSLSQVVFRYTPAGGGGIDEGVSCGFPIPYKVLTLGYNNAGIRHARLIFTSDPISPFGKLPVFMRVTSVPAASTATPLSGYNLGIMKTIQVVSQGSRAHHIDIDGTYLGNTITYSPLVTVAAAAGGYAISALIPAPRILSLSIVNDDAVNLLTHNLAVIGYFN